MYEDGIVMCRQRDGSDNYVEDECNLEFNWKQGDTLIFGVDNLLYQS